MFSAGGRLCLAAGESVEFEAQETTGGCFGVSYGSIVIRRSGTYCAAVTVDIPKGAEVDTVMRLELSGRSAPLAEIPVEKDCGGASANFAGHAVFTAGEGAVLKLTTLNDFEIPCGCGRPIIKLLIHRVGSADGQLLPRLCDGFSAPLIPARKILTPG
jgi:hypothetical protein